mmetsp:Transcript_33661/g.84713  ORF Transcript_33661/g.84713 Transcript_33661/m.84713 type:complete len:502 (-) Transcript_33661:172-1677(-)
MARLMASRSRRVTTWISCTWRPARASKLYPSATTTLVSQSSRSWLTTRCSTACRPGMTASIPSSVSRLAQMSSSPGSGVSSSSSSSTEGSGIATGMIVSSVSSSGSAWSCLREKVMRAGFRSSLSTTSSTLTSTSWPTRTTSRGCEMRFQLSSEMWMSPSRRGAAGSVAESSTKAPKSDSDTTRPDVRMPTLSALAPWSCTSARSDTTIFLSSIDVTMTLITAPTCSSMAATTGSFGALSFAALSLAAAAMAAGLPGAGGAAAAGTGAGRGASSSSSKDERGPVRSFWVRVWLWRPLMLAVRLDAIWDKGRKARKRPLKMRRISPPRFATSTRPNTGSPVSRASASAFLASSFFWGPLAGFLATAPVLASAFEPPLPRPPPPPPPPFPLPLPPLAFGFTASFGAVAVAAAAAAGFAGASASAAPSESEARVIITVPRPPRTWGIPRGRTRIVGTAGRIGRRELVAAAARPATAAVHCARVAAILAAWSSFWRLVPNFFSPR